LSGPTIEQFAAENGYRITGVRIIKDDNGGKDDRIVTLERKDRRLVIDSQLFDDVARSMSPVANPVKDSPVKAVG